MNKIEARELAAQIWCKLNLSNREMDPPLCEEIAQTILKIHDKAIEKVKILEKALKEIAKGGWRFPEDAEADTIDIAKEALAKWEKMR